MSIYLENPNPMKDKTKHEKNKAIKASKYISR